MINLLKWLQFLTIVFTPLYIVRGVVIIPTTLLELLILLTVLIWFIIFAKEGFPFKKIRTKLDIYIFFFLVSALVAAFMNPDIISGLGIFRAYFLEPIIFFYTLIFTIRRLDNRFIIYALVLSGVWLMGLSLLQKITGSFTLAPHEIALGRVSAVYNSANALALYLGPISILSLIFVFSKKFKVKLLGIVLFILFFLTIVWTKSRGGLIAEILSILTFIYILISQKKKIFSKYWLIIPIILITCSTLFFYQVYSTYNQTALNYKETMEDSDTLRIRYFLWTGSLNLIKENPVFGAGLEGFKTLYDQEYKLHESFEAFQYPHNIFLTFWAELGIFGLISFLFLFLTLLRVLMLSVNKTKYSYILASLTAVFIYWLIHGLVDVPYFKNDLSLEFWAFTALAVYYAKEYI